MGGLGTGCVGLSGNGRLVDWEIFNRPDKGSVNGHTHLSIRAEKEGEVLDTRVLQGDLLPPYTGSLKRSTMSYGSGPPRQFLAGTPHFRTTSFRGEFPIAVLTLKDEEFPGDVALTAFNPFIPINDKDSGIPGAFFEIEISNTHESALTYTVCFCVNNPHPAGATNSYLKQAKVSMMRMSSTGMAADDPEFGDMTVATDADEVSYQERWRRIGYEGRWIDDVTAYWRELNTPGKFTNRTSTLDSRGGEEKSNHCLLAAHIDVNPRATGKVRFLLTWSFPNCTNSWGPPQEGTESCCDSGTCVPNKWKNYYATVWKDSAASAQYGLSHWDRLASETASFKEALFGSTLPAAVIDAISANISILKSPTVLRLEDSTFYGWEGCHAEAGCCEGSCTHVWNYAYALPFLFPQLERSMREAEYRYNMGDDGGMTFRLQLPLGSPRWAFRPCVDGQFGGVIKVYREWKISGDSKWLAELWPAVKKSLSFAWSPENVDRWDADKDGVLEGRQHNTLDAELFGPSSWLNGYYLAALKAAAEMADFLGESEEASEYRILFEKGNSWVEENLFNGEYYHQKIDLNDKRLLERFAGPPSETPNKERSEDDIFWDDYWDHERNEIMYQVGEGCSIDQMVAQWHANLCGLGEVFDKQHTATALRSIYRYNFIRGMRQVFNRNRRVYSLNDESAVLICSYPREEPATPLPFAAETMNGFEYQFACHLIQEGLVDEGVEVVEAIRERFDGEKRNPWNEFECGSNYARSMASYSLLLALSGFEYDMRQGVIGFHPKQNRQSGRFFWCLNRGWGTVEFSSDSIELAVLYGSLGITELRSEILAHRDVGRCAVDGLQLECTRQGGAVTFADSFQIEAGSVLRLDL